MKKFFKWVGFLFLIAIVVQVIKSSEENKSGKPDGTQAEVTSAKPALPLPQDQVNFIGIVKKAQEANKSAANDMQKGAARATREKDLCSLLPQLGVSGWVGKVYTVSSNSDGLGVLEVLIAPDIYVKTWNNALSDAFDHTLMAPGSELFNKVSQLKEQQEIKFSGSFFRDSGDPIGCISESSLTLNGKLSEPEFIFRFSDVSPL